MEVDDHDFDSSMADNILEGTQAIDLSHAGGEFLELVNEDMKRSRR